MAKSRKNTEQQKNKIISVPKEETDSMSIRIPKKTAKYAAGVLCLLLLVMVVAFVDYRHTMATANADKTELTALRQNNNDQVKQIEQLSKATANLQADMERLNVLDAELRRIVSNPDITATAAAATPTSRAGLIRPPIPYSNYEGTVQLNSKELDQVLIQLQESVTVREKSLLELKEELVARQGRNAAKPSIWPTTGTVTSRFGWRNSPSGAGSDFHPGIDIANSTGTPIVATADGVVVQSEWFSGYGETVQIDHGHGIVTLYGHNSQRVVMAGQTVKKGQLIAYLGSTGYSTGPHVHYEIRVNGTAVNPENFLKE